MAALSSVLAQIRSHESVGAANRLGISPYDLTPQQNFGYPKSHASGAYQFQPATWRGYAQEAGIGTQFSEAYMAPPATQDALAAYVVAKHGTGDWTPYSGPVAPVTSIDVDPYQLAYSGGPGLTGAVAGQSGGNTGVGIAPSIIGETDNALPLPGGPAASDPYFQQQYPGVDKMFPEQPSGVYNPSYGGGFDYGSPYASPGTGQDYGYGPTDSTQPGGVGANPGTGDLMGGGAGSDFFKELLSDLWNFSMRGALILLGIVLIAVGGYWLSAQALK